MTAELRSLSRRYAVLVIAIVITVLGISTCGCNLLLPTADEDNVAEAWVSRYGGETTYDDGGQAIAIDSSGNIYVTGYSWGDSSSNDYATVKYDNDGNCLWVARYNGSANAEDWALDLVLDISGNLYVTGWSQGNGTDADGTTIKYDGQGNQLWVARYDGPASGYDLAHAIASDFSSNIYITGWSQSNDTGSDCATIKYDSNGNQLWVARYNGPISGDDRSYAIAVDGWANVFITGWSQGNGTGADYTTLKYDSEGNQLWVVRYDGPMGGDDKAQNIAVDVLGNVYITGWSQGNGTRADYATIMYSNNGDLLWEARYDGPASGEDNACDLVVDSFGDVYITGWSQGSGTGADYTTLKYNSNGDLLWEARYDGPMSSEDVSRTIGLDISQNVYVSGWSRGSRYRYDYATIKYDNDGNQLWAIRYDGPAEGLDMVYSMAVEDTGNIYVTGSSTGNTTYYDYTTIKYVQQ
ncbi:MAG: SBBP repeat-containing protein [Dehalococcoidia bacterium]|nr:MAG: SBBP repeat-containing protein [Dehalococcoidia bacterium]